MPHLQTRVAFLPYGPKLLKSLKPVGYEREPRTLGQRLKKRRVELGLFQRELRNRFNLEKETYANWEKDRCIPTMKHWPLIIDFLGFDPNPAPNSFGTQLTAYRRRHGLSRRTLALFLGVDEATLWRWESEEIIPGSKSLFQISALLELKGFARFDTK